MERHDTRDSAHEPWQSRVGKRWVEELGSLARRISLPTPTSVSGRMAMLLALLFAVGLLGGLRIGESGVWLAPPLFTLVLAALTLGALNRHGILPLRRLLYSSPAAVDLHGLLVIVAIIFASAQAFHVASPVGGLPRLLVYLLFLFSLLALNTRLVAPDHARMLWTLVVVFGTAFTVTFVVLPSSPLGGAREWLCRVLPGCQPRHPATGYIAFLTLFLYLSVLAGLARMTRVTSGVSVADSNGDPEPEDQVRTPVDPQSAPEESEVG